TTSQIGSVVARIQCSMATYPDTHAPPSRLADNTATALSAGTPVHAVKGFSPRCRLAAYVAGHPRTYVAVNNTQHGPVTQACAKGGGYSEPPIAASSAGRLRSNHSVIRYSGSATKDHHWTSV